MTAIGDKVANRWHLQFAQRWVVQYNFDINDRNWGRMFVRVCPYLPFSARVCLNQHHWLANRMRVERIDFKQCSNAFLKCSHPQKPAAHSSTALMPASSPASTNSWLQSVSKPHDQL